MNRRRIAIILVLILAPFVVWALLGSYFLWREGLMLVVWWPLFIATAIGYFLAWLWQRQQKLIAPVDFTPAQEWTERDREAWKLVEARSQAAAQLDVATLTDLELYQRTAQEMALELARFYHPKAEDPVSAATIPEILAVIEFASHDLAEIVDRYLPAGNLLTIRNWRQAKKALDWYPTLNTLYWIGSAIFSPLSTAQRYLASHVGISTPWKAIQDNALVFFYTAFVQRVGTYLIELNSGRLRVGASRYLELKRKYAEMHAAEVDVERVEQVTITIMGQTKAGKSSLINALLGEQRAKTDVLPLTAGVSRYELQLPDIPTRLVLLDTVGYGHSGPKEDEVKATQEAVRESDLVLLALHARNPARQHDLEMLQKVGAWCRQHPALKKPVTLGVLTHIDLLSTSLEWAPPYNWHKPTRPKEEQIAQAVAAAQEQLTTFLSSTIPVCTSPGKVYGVQEELLPRIVQSLDEARAVAFIRCVQAEASANKARRVVRQLVALALQAGQMLLTPSMGSGIDPSRARSAAE